MRNRAYYSDRQLLKMKAIPVHCSNWIISIQYQILLLKQNVQECCDYLLKQFAITSFIIANMSLSITNINCFYQKKSLNSYKIKLIKSVNLHSFYLSEKYFKLETSNYFCIMFMSKLKVIVYKCKHMLLSTLQINCIRKKKEGIKFIKNQNLDYNYRKYLL